MDPVHPIRTKIGRNILLLNPGNKLTEEFLTVTAARPSLQQKFHPRPIFSRVRNAMKLSFAFHDHSNYPKFEMAAFWVKINVLRLNTCSDPVLFGCAKYPNMYMNKNVPLSLG